MSDPIKTMLLAFSEWLDGDEGLLSPDDPEKHAPERTHEELVQAFLESRG